MAHKHSIPVVADIESADLPDLACFLSRVDHLIVGIGIAAAMSGERTAAEMVRALSTQERPACVVTDGANGCWYNEHGGVVKHFPAYQVICVDTTGCGDVFHGTYTAALARGEPVSRAIQIASASAALKATCCGGRDGIPNLAQVEHFIRERGVVLEEG